MNLNKIILISICFITLYSCADYKTNIQDKKYFSSFGFALIYEDSLFEEETINKKIDNNKIVIFHSYLKKNTPIKIINPVNSKLLEAKVSNQAKYPNFFNILISKKAADFLELDLNNPYVEIHEVKKNKTFVAKEGTIFEEEKNVEIKVPIKKVEISDLSTSTSSKKANKTIKNKFIILIGDFYYRDSAELLKKELSKKTQIDKFIIREVKSNKFRLLVGPFKNFSSLKSAYISLNNLEFENLNIFKE